MSISKSQKRNSLATSPNFPSMTTTKTVHRLTAAKNHNMKKEKKKKELFLYV